MWLDFIYKLLPLLLATAMLFLPVGLEDQVGQAYVL